MSIEDFLQALIKAPRLDKAYLSAGKALLLAQLEHYDELDWSDSQRFDNFYSAAVGLMVARIRDGRDPDPCDELGELVLRAPMSHTNYGFSFFTWINELSEIDLTGADDGLSPEDAAAHWTKRLSTDALISLIGVGMQALKRQVDALVPDRGIDDEEDGDEDDDNEDAA